MKRTITALLAAMLVLFSACGQTGTNDTQGSDPSSTSAPDTEPIAEVNPDARYPHETSAYGGKTFTILN